MTAKLAESFSLFFCKREKEGCVLLDTLVVPVNLQDSRY
jgi:hypothetical protein